MRWKDGWKCGVAALVLTGCLAAPVGAMTMQEVDLNALVAGNSAIVLATVDGAGSYWSPGTRFILTDFSLTAQQVIKGSLPTNFAITMMGGKVGAYTTLIPGAAQIFPGKTYLLFLGEVPLPGTRPVLTVGYHTQGVFDIETRNGVRWATSQAADAPLIPMEGQPEGELSVPGGTTGMSLDDLIRQIQALLQSQTTSTGGLR